MGQLNEVKLHLLKDVLRRAIGTERSAIQLRYYEGYIKQSQSDHEKPFVSLLGITYDADTAHGTVRLERQEDEIFAVITEEPVNYRIHGMTTDHPLYAPGAGILNREVDSANRKEVRFNIDHELPEDWYNRLLDMASAYNRQQLAPSRRARPQR